MFFIVEFKEGLHLVPECWLNEEKTGCMWPIHVQEQVKLNKMVMSQTPPEENWTTCKVLRVFGGAVSEYVTGIKKLQLYMDLSDLETEASSQKQRRELKKKYPHDYWNSSISYPTVPPALAQEVTEVEESQSIISKPGTSKTKKRRQEFENEDSPSLLGNPVHPDVPQEEEENCSFLTFSTQDNIQILANPGPSECNCQGKIVEMSNILEQVLYKCNYLVKKVNNIASQIETSKTNQNDFPNDEVSSVMKSFPLHSEKELEEFEKSLCDEKNYQNLVKGLKGIGGSSTYLVVTKILKRVLTNELGELFSLVGAKKKRSFKALILFKVILETTRLSFPSVTEEEVGNLISNWLRHSKQRRERAQGTS